MCVVSITWIWITNSKRKKSYPIHPILYFHIWLKQERYFNNLCYIPNLATLRAIHTLTFYLPPSLVCLILLKDMDSKYVIFE